MQKATVENIVERVGEQLGRDGGQTVINISSEGISAIGKGMHLTEIRNAIPQLEAACNRAIEVNDEFTHLCKLIALKGGTDPGVLKTFITARCNDRVMKTEAKAEQLQILFSEISD